MQGSETTSAACVGNLITWRIPSRVRPSGINTWVFSFKSHWSIFQQQGKWSQNWRLVVLTATLLWCRAVHHRGGALASSWGVLCVQSSRGVTQFQWNPSLLGQWEGYSLWPVFTETGRAFWGTWLIFQTCVVAVFCKAPFAEKLR